MKIYIYECSMAILVIASFSSRLFAQAGELDLTFSADGKVTTSVGSNAGASSVAIQPDGKIVAVGTSFINPNDDFCLVRYYSTGALDGSFSTDGKVTTDFGYADRGNDVIVQPDGKILAVGATYTSSYDFALVRYYADGTLDNSFSLDGKLTTSISSLDDIATSVALQSDGKIVVLGLSGVVYNYIIALVRYNTDGSLDNSFDSDGIVTTSIDGVNDEGHSVAIQSDGKIIVGGTSYDGNKHKFALVRYNTDGTLDNTFGTNGIVTTTNEFYVRGFSVAIKPDGKIILAGDLYNGHENFALAQYNIDGSLDSSFGTNGIVTTAVVAGDDNIAYSVTLQPDGKIIAAGITYTNYQSFSSDFALVRYNVNGAIDSSFSVDGKVTTSFGTDVAFGSSVAIQPDGKIVLAGHAGANFALARYLSGLNVGILNFTSFSTSPLIYPNPIQETEVFKYTLTKDEVLSLRLYDVNGSLIKTFFTDETRLAGEHTEELNFENLTSGNYLLALSNGNQQIGIKMVK